MRNIDRLQLIKQAREQAFSRPILEEYHFKILSTEEFWRVWVEDFHIHAPLDLFFEEENLRTDVESKKLKLLYEPHNIHAIEDNYLLVDTNDNVVAMMRGWQKNFDSYYMQFTAVHQDHRKKGIYSALIDSVLIYTKLLGFSRVLSSHAPYNKAVLIAKLKKDFNFVSMEVDPAFGICIWLCYFHNLELKKAYEVRCGGIAFSEKLFSASYGTAEQFCELISKSKPANIDS